MHERLPPELATSDILVIGGGVAGLSAAAALSEHAKVTVLEAEEADRLPFVRAEARPCSIMRSAIRWSAR